METSTWLSDGFQDNLETYFRWEWDLRKLEALEMSFRESNAGALQEEGLCILTCSSASLQLEQRPEPGRVCFGHGSDHHLDTDWWRSYVWPKKTKNDSRKRGCCSQSSTGGSWHLYSEQKLGVTVGKLCWESCSKMGSIFKEGLDHGSSGNQCWIITAIRTVGKNAFLVKLTDYSPHLPIPIWYLQLQHWLTRK